MPRRGVTLVELMAVIGTIGVMILMLLPALLGAGELARQVECRNGQKELALGLLNYHSAHECFPPGYYAVVGSDGRAVGRGLSWGVAILPHIEQVFLEGTLSRDVPVAAPENQTFRTASIKVFICPSSVFPSESRTQSLPLGVRGGLLEVARSSVVASFGTGDLLDPTTAARRSDGMFMRDRCVRIEDVSDGTSSTFLLGERGRDSGPASWAGIVGETGTALVLGSTAGDPGPNAPPLRATGFSSRHPGGAYFSFGDGGVRFVKDSIGAGVYHALATRGGGDIVSDEPE